MARFFHNRLKQRRASQAAMLVAAAAIPNTFQKTLMPRKTVDQGAVTGATMAVDYLIIVTIRKFIEDMADSIAGTKNAKNDNFEAHLRQKRFAFLLDTLVLIAAVYGEKQYSKEANESDKNAIIRTASSWLKYAAIAGISIALLDSLFGNSKDSKLSARYKTPWGLIGGAAFATYTEYQRRSKQKNTPLVPIAALIF